MEVRIQNHIRSVGKWADLYHTLLVCFTVFSSLSVSKLFKKFLFLCVDIYVIVLRNSTIFLISVVLIFVPPQLCHLTIKNSRVFEEKGGGDMG